MTPERAMRLPPRRVIRVLVEPKFDLPSPVERAFLVTPPSPASPD